MTTQQFNLHRKFNAIGADVQELSSVDKQGFACETRNCPCGASLGRSENGVFPVDVRCEDCAERLGWVAEIDEGKSRRKQITINVNGKEIEKHNFFSDESKTPLPIMKIMKEVEE